MKSKFGVSIVGECVTFSILIIFVSVTNPMQDDDMGLEAAINSVVVPNPMPKSSIEILGLSVDQKLTAQKEEKVKSEKTVIKPEEDESKSENSFGKKEAEKIDSETTALAAPSQKPVDQTALTTFPAALAAPNQEPVDQTALTTFPEQGSDTSAFRLMNKLLSRKNYDKRVRPRRQSSDSLLVTFRLNLYQILDVIEPSQTIVLHTWVTQMWQDEFLGWNPAKYDDIDWAVVPFEEIWLPDTFLYNGLEMYQKSAERMINVLLETRNRSGSWIADVRLMYPAIYTFSCKLQVEMFPFDVQICNVTLGAWTHNMAAIDYVTESEFVQLENYVQHDQWSLLSFKWLREEVKFSCCPVPWVLLHARLKIQRKPLFYLVNLVLPSVVITLVAVAGFYLPSNTTGERHEKVSLGITTLLAMAILLLMVVESMPSTSESVPLIGVFYLIVILVISLGTSMTTIVIVIQKKGAYGRKLSNFSRKMAICFARMMGVSAKPALLTHWREQQQNGDKHKNGMSSRVNKAVTPPFYFHSTAIEEKVPCEIQQKISSQKQSQNEDIANLFDCDGHAGEQLGIVRIEVTDHHAQNLSRKPSLIDSNEDLIRILEWEFVADVMDRAMLFVFTTLVIGVTLFITGVGFLGQEGHPLG